jgi:hypothetical protein
MHTHQKSSDPVATIGLDIDKNTVAKDVIRQFVAMPLGSGYSVEEQITGKPEHGGLQIIVYPMRREHYSYCVISFVACAVAVAPQHGHRGKALASARIKRVRMVAIEFGTWRSGRKGGSSGSITFG